MSAQCAAGFSKLDEHVRKPTWGYIHVQWSQLWESDLMKKRKLSDISSMSGRNFRFWSLHVQYLNKSDLNETEQALSCYLSVLQSLDDFTSSVFT